MPKLSSISWTVIGHAAQKRFLENALAADRLAHAYLFVGPEHIGKTALALDLARALVCTGGGAKPCGECPGCRMPSGANPDIALIDQPDGIKIEAIRQLKAVFALASFGGGLRVAIIANADTLTPEAANAFLKFLEEPAAHTTIVLTAASRGALPQTIASRAQLLHFAANTAEDFTEAAARSGKPAPKRLVEYAGGRLGVLMSLLASPELVAEFDSQFGLWQELGEGPLHGRLTRVADLASWETPDIAICLTRWLHFTAATLRTQSGDRQAAGLVRLAALAAAIENLHKSLNKRLLLDNLILKL